MYYVLEKSREFSRTEYTSPHLQPPPWAESSQQTWRLCIVSFTFSRILPIGELQQYVNESYLCTDVTSQFLSLSVLGDVSRGRPAAISPWFGEIVSLHWVFWVIMKKKLQDARPLRNTSDPDSRADGMDRTIPITDNFYCALPFLAARVVCSRRRSREGDATRDMYQDKISSVPSFLLWQILRTQTYEVAPLIFTFLDGE